MILGFVFVDSLVWFVDSIVGHWLMTLVLWAGFFFVELLFVVSTWGYLFEVLTVRVGCEMDGEPSFLKPSPFSLYCCLD